MPSPLEVGKPRAYKLLAGNDSYLASSKYEYLAGLNLSSSFHSA
ncbi:Uncharacterised protein [Mycoplasmoides gallisepticum]|uniref:Uncharacterized protein n=1 Tax=Mycoplasmoides gallisepticum TaxID=2096 RepID=A0A3B0Q3D9_MYCGL|nr:Uncharacterised protein [Mycoplasmoides gallisepticum]